MLIDGDRLNVSFLHQAFFNRGRAHEQFEDTFLQAGWQGGLEAAQAVIQAVNEACPMTSRLLVQVFINKSGLQTSLVKVSTARGAPRCTP